MNAGFKLSASLFEHPIIVTFKDGIEAYVMEFFIGFTHELFSNEEPEERVDNMDIFMNLNPPPLWLKNVLYHVHSINYKKEKLPRYYCFA
ncbi:hypothetical protein [Algoriphagus formosus]|uniref:hypothetical protein n=1 Tax=Algoriphagus formosus TaxID=2007308 RepID=UPI000C294FB6|nr:hypothetical protein [Algoriphagus formosus]